MKLTDRELQDEIIRYVTDPQARRWAGALKLSAREASRAAQFARFLARRYYRDRLGRSFRYSAMLESRRHATDLVEAEDFEALLGADALGSFALAQTVGQRAVEWMMAAGKQNWWQSLLEYERAHFLQTATSEMRAPASALQRGLSAACVSFDWDMPELLRLIKTKQTIAEDLWRSVTLLFSRTRSGGIYVMEVDRPTAAIFGAVDGHRDEEAISHAAGIDGTTAQTILNSLIEIGAIAAPPAENATEQFQPERVLGI